MSRQWADVQWEDVQLPLHAHTNVIGYWWSTRSIGIPQSFSCTRRVSALSLIENFSFNLIIAIYYIATNFLLIVYRIHCIFKNDFLCIAIIIQVCTWVVQFLMYLASYYFSVLYSKILSARSNIYSYQLKQFCFKIPDTYCRIREGIKALWMN